MPAVMWFRRDLRLHDHPALLAACDAAGDGVVPLFVLDAELWSRAGQARLAWLSRSLHALDESLGGSLVLRTGNPVEVVPAVAAEAQACSVHISADYGPYGAERDAQVAQALDGTPLEATGSPYAVAPGRVLTGGGEGYQVFTPFLRAWVEHGWRGPVDPPKPSQTWVDLGGDTPPEEDPPEGMTLPEVGEGAARRKWRDFLPRLAGYPEDRDRPDREGTSRLSPHLRWGEIHPRTLLADLAEAAADRSLREPAAKFRAELGWREFHADVLHRHPAATREPLRAEFAEMRWDEPGPELDAWKEGRTGFPVVDAGMRELRATGTMHNRVRMIAASFLIKDLHLDWRLGARHFMDYLVDGDLASNQLNWQWVAGSGSDAAPYFRVFNPTSQGRRFDPEGAYIRRWVPELADAEDPHQPGSVAGYPAPVVDHAVERRVALDRWQEIRR